MDINGAELIIRHFQTEGVTHVVSARGSDDAALRPLQGALAGSKLNHVVAADEQGAAFIAQGIAHASGRAGVCLTTAAALTRLLAALAGAYTDAVPLVAICVQLSSPRSPRAGRALNVGQLVEGISKAHLAPRSVDDLVDLLPEAFRVAESERPGPVVLELPAQLQTARLRLVQLPGRTPREIEEPAYDSRALLYRASDAQAPSGVTPAPTLQSVLLHRSSVHAPAS